MYTVEEISGAALPHVVRMSFELPYLDWCRFEKSALYTRLTEYLEELKSQDNPQKCSPVTIPINADVTQVLEVIREAEEKAKQLKELVEEVKELSASIKLSFDKTT